MGKNKKEDHCFVIRKKTKEIQNSATMMISVGGMGVVFLGKLRTKRGIVCIKILKKRILKQI